MASRRTDTQAVSRSEAVKALSKAAEFLSAAEASLEACRWNAAGLEAIHAGIACADAGLIATCGMRSISEDHGAVVRLLEAEVASFGAGQRRQILGLLKMRNTVAYERRPLSQMEARQLVDHARRLVRWSGEVVDRIA